MFDVTTRFHLALACAAAFGASACSDPEVPPQPVPTAPVPTMGPMPTEPAPTTAVPTATAPAAPAPAPEPHACDAVLQIQLQTAIKAREKGELSGGMKPESSFSCMVVPEGGKATVPVTLQSGRCYTFIAHSLPNVAELDLFLKPNFGPTPPPLLAAFANAPLAQDSDSGPAATVGKGTNCFKNPLPVPGAAVVEVVAKTGSGPIAVQVYSK